MLLSELLNLRPDEDVVKIVNEHAFDRFARTTSTTQGPICVYVASKSYLSTVPDNAVMVITSPEINANIEDADFGICISKDPKATYFRLFNISAELEKKEERPSTIGENTVISPLARISPVNVQIGRDTQIEDFAVIHENVVIGDHCIIRSGTNIGMQDYNYYMDKGIRRHLWHFGKTIIGNHVEIGYGSMVGQALYPNDSTIIMDNVKIGFLSIVGHDALLGKNVMVYDRAIIGGYTRVGQGSQITLSATVKNGLVIGENVHVGMGSVVIRDIPDGETVFGNPAKRMIVPR